MAAPYLIGAANTAAGSTLVTVTAGTVNGTAGAGQIPGCRDALIVCASANNAAATVSSVTDSTGAGDTYSSPAGAGIGTVPGSFIFGCAPPGNVLGAGGTFAVTYASANGTKNAVAIGVPGATGIDTAGCNDASGTSASTPSVTTGTLANPGEIVIAAVTYASGGGTFSWAAGWAQLIAPFHNGSGSFTTVAWSQALTTGPVTASGTGTTVAWTAVVMPLVPGPAPFTPWFQPRTRRFAKRLGWVAGTTPGAAVASGAPFAQPPRGRQSRPRYQRRGRATGGAGTPPVAAAVQHAIPRTSPPPLTRKRKRRKAAHGGSAGTPAVPIRYPYLIGAASEAAGTATLTVAVGSGGGTAPVTGDALAVLGSSNSNGAQMQSVTDSAGNGGYSNPPGASNAAIPGSWLFAALEPALAGGSGSFTLTYGGTSPGSGTKNGIAVGVPYAVAADTAAVANAAGNSAAVSVTTGPLASPGEMLVAAVSYGSGGGGAVTWADGWTPFLAPISSGTGPFTTAAWHQATGTAPVTAALTVGSGSPAWTAAAVPFVISQLLIATTSLPGATETDAYSAALGATGGFGGYTWSITSGSLPAGLTLHPGGLISGTPAASGVFYFTVEVTDAGGQSATQVLWLAVGTPGGAFVVQSWTGGSSGNYGMLPIPVANNDGNALVAFVGWSAGSTSPVANMADDAHNCWFPLALSPSSGDCRCAIFIAPNAQACTNVSVGLTWYSYGLTVIIAEMAGLPQWMVSDISANGSANGPSPGTAGPFGCTIYPTGGSGLANVTSAVNAWNSLILAPIGQSIGIRKQYYSDAGQGAIFSAGNPPDSYVFAAANLGQELIVCYKPTFLPGPPWGIATETTSLVASLLSIITPIPSIGYPGIPASKLRCVIWQEANNGEPGFPSAVEYWQLVNFHQAAIRSPSGGYPGVQLWHDLTRNSTSPLAWFPGPPNLPVCVVDGYLNDWYVNNLLSGHSPVGDVALAKANGIPWGLGEIGSLGAGTGQVGTQEEVTQYLTGDPVNSVLACLLSCLDFGFPTAATAWYQTNSDTQGPLSFTATSGIPCVFTARGSSFPDGWEVIINSGTLPPAFATGHTYWAVNVSGDTFNLAASPAGSALISLAAFSGTLTGWGPNDLLTPDDFRIPLLRQIARATSNSSGNSALETAGTATVADVAFSVIVSNGNTATVTGMGAGWNPVATVSVDDPRGAGNGPGDVTMTASWQAVSPGPVLNSWQASAGIPLAACLAAIQQSPAVPAAPNPDWPLVTVEMAFGFAPGTVTDMPVFTDMTSRTIGEPGDTVISASRGRQYESESPEAGDLTVTLSNQDGALTPTNQDSPFWPGILLGTITRVRAWWNGRMYGVGYGFTERIPQTWPGFPQWGQVPWEAPDGLDPLANSQLPSAFAGEILADSPYLYIPCGDTYLAQGAAGLPLSNLSRTSQRPMICTNATWLPQSGNIQTRYLQTGLSWQVTTTGQVQNFLGLPGDPSTAVGTTVATDQALAIAVTPEAGAFYQAQDFPQPGNGVTAEFWFAVDPTLKASSPQNAELLRIGGPPNNWYSQSRQPRLQVAVNTTEVLLTFESLSGQSATPLTFSAVVTDGNPHHFAVTILLGQDGHTAFPFYTVSAYLDGQPEITGQQVGGALTGLAVNDWDYLGIGGVIHNDGGIAYGYNCTIGHVAIFPEVLPYQRIQAHYNAAWLASAGDSSVQRVAKLLLWGGFGMQRACSPASPSPVLGNADQVAGQSVVDAVSTVATTSGGMLYADAQGNITWWDRQFLYNRPVRWVFGDNPANGEIPYLPTQQYDYDNTFVSNDVSSQRQVSSSQDGALVTAADQASEQQYFTRSSLQETIETTSDQDAHDQVNWLLAKYAQPALRLEQIVLDPASNPAVWPAALGIEQGDIAMVIRRPLGGAVIAMTGIVQQVSHATGPGKWQTTVTMTPYDIESAVLQCDAPGFSMVAGNSIGW